MSAEDAYNLLDAIATINGSQDKLKRVKKVSNNSERTARPAINFTKCNIPIGAELIFVGDSSVKVIVESDRKVLYNNEITSLSAVAKKLKGYKTVQGSSYFTYNGKLITEIAKETQWKNDD